MFARVFRFIREALTPKTFSEKSKESTANHAKKADVDRPKEPKVEVNKSMSRNPQREHPSSEPVVVIDSNTGKVVEEIPPVMTTESSSFSRERHSSSDFAHNLPT